MRKYLIMLLLGIISVFSTYGAENNILVIYFSRTGTTKKVAEQIQKEINGDIFEIEIVNLYPEEYRATTDQAKKELAEGYLPPLKSKAENLDEYDTIFLGYPIWWGTMPMPVFSFLNENNLSGKKIIPFATHQGSGLGRSISDLTKAVPDGNVEKEGKAVRGSISESEIKEWLEKVLK
ncbi:flavodoxin [Fusobacterium varium]|uniref:flavodoxin n=1 Tax=Fusobacterium varium TaxID=856 RepID=UPI000BBAD537|nr:flavodoxin [uncultured Fusobacterium sp.]BBA51396.1 flavodoxin [Fusobacterium varium]